MTRPTHVSGTIKPLEWVGVAKSGYAGAEIARTSTGYYTVMFGAMNNDGNVCWAVSHSAIASKGQLCQSSDEAKAAAQADYEARVAGQIQPDAEAQPVASSELGELVSRDAAIAACSLVQEKAKSYNIPQMAMGAAACIDDIRALPAARAEVNVAEAAQFFVHLIDNGRGSVEGDSLSDALSRHGLDAEDFADALRALTEVGK